MLHPGSVFTVTGNEHVTHIMPHTTLVSGVCEMFFIGEFYCFVFMTVQLDFIRCLINTFTLGLNACSDLQETVSVIYFQKMGRVHLEFNSNSSEPLSFKF
jgi:hypothetical protein